MDSTTPTYAPLSAGALALMAVVKPVANSVVEPVVTPVTNWRARGDSNARPLAPQASALSAELRARTYHGPVLIFRMQLLSLHLSLVLLLNLS